MPAYHRRRAQEERAAAAAAACAQAQALHLDLAGKYEAVAEALERAARASAARSALD